MRRSIAVALTLALLALAVAPAARAEDPTPETRFLLRVRGDAAGFGWYRITPAEDGLTRIEGETVLKLLQDGRETVLRSRRSTLVGPEDRIPRAYRATISRDADTSEYDCRHEGEAFVLEAKIRGTPARASFPLASIGAFLDYNAPEHFEIFLRGRLRESRPFQCSAVVTEMMSALPVQGRIGGEEEVEVDGGTVRATRVEFSALGMLYRAWIDSAGRLARIEVPSQKFAAVRTERRLEELELTPADLIRSFTVPLQPAGGVKPPGPAARRPGGVREARFRVRVRTGENRMDGEVLSNLHQTLTPADPTTGPVEPGWIVGTLTVHPNLRAGRDGARPTADDAVRLAEFLLPEDAIESDAPEIRARAAEVIPDGTPPLEAARRAADWVHGSMSYETQLVSALAAHQGRVGDCLSMARLTIALLRARGVPARVIGGIALGGGRRLGQHHWVEVWGGTWCGWIQIDPTYGQSEGIDAFHLDLWRQGTIDGSAENEVVLEGWE